VVRLTSRYIDWKLQNQYDDGGNEILPRPKEDEVDEERLLAWREGRTGFP
jgi:cryptochrome